MVGFHEVDRKLLYVTSEIPSTLKFCDVTFRKFLSLEKNVQMEITQCLAYDLENKILIDLFRQPWNLQALSNCALCLMAPDHDFGTKYSLESTIVYLPVGASEADLLLTLVSNTSLGSGHDPFVRCQHRHFITGSGNDEEINVKKNVFQGRY